MLGIRRLPSYIINGITVAMGIGLVQILFALVVDARAAQMASIGATYASLAHLADRAGRAFRRVFLGGSLGCVASIAVASLRGHPVVLGGVIATIVFASMMMMAWGKRAAPIAFSAILAMIFSMALPTTQPITMTATWSALGVLAYALWAFGSTLVLAPRYRTLSVAATLRATAKVLRTRARVLVASEQAPTHAAAGWLAEEASLAELLQSARDLVFYAAESSTTRRQAAILIRAIDLRDILLASRLDLDVLGEDSAGRAIRDRVGDALRAVADAVERAYERLLGSTQHAVDARPTVEALFRNIAIAKEDSRTRVITIISNRLIHLGDDVRLINASIDGFNEELPLSHANLRRFVADDSWPVKALSDSLSLDSPVFRHALRTALAIACVYFLAYGVPLPWAPHPHWLVLTVAVVLRGTLDQTLARRNQRIIGTAIGCIAVTLLADFFSTTGLRFVFPIAAGAAHAFSNIRYMFTASSASIMALSQARLVDPSARFVAVERLLDTVIGALFAWLFSYVLPSWERRTLPHVIERAFTELRDYAHYALAIDEPSLPLEQRLTRQRAYDALEAVAAAIQRSSVEPKRVKPPLEELYAFVDYGQSLMAHLSAARLVLVRRAEHLRGEEAKHALRRAQETLHAVLSSLDSATELPNTPHRPAELPPTPIDEAPLPWLLRRLQATTDDGVRVSQAGRAALAKLKVTETA